MTFHAVANSGRPAPIQKTLLPMNAGSLPFPGSTIASGTWASGNARRSRSTHWRRRITVPQKVAVASPASAMVHHVSGRTQTVHGKVSPSGIPWKNHSITPPSLGGKAHFGRWGSSRLAHWFSGVAK